MTTNIRSSADGSKSHIAVGGTDRVTIDAATGAVGIGCTPTYKLQVQSSSAVASTFIAAENPGGTDLIGAGFLARVDGANYSTIMKQGNGRLSIENLGALGVITTNQSDDIGFNNGGARRLNIKDTGEVLVVSPAGLGYGPGAGGTVTQATSKSTAVTLNKPSGKITMNAANLGAGGAVAFTLYNSLIGPYDTVQMNLGGGASVYTNYEVRCAGVGAGGGAATVFVKNLSAGNLAEALILNFTIIKGATS